jgi:hypothetical protein
MQNFLIDIMTEIPISKKENSSFEENISWKDIQGLSWTLEQPDFELKDKFSTYVCA